MNSNNEVINTTTIVDDVELLAILGLSAPSSPLCDTIAVLDWDDMPELSEEEGDDDDTNSVNLNNNNNKRKYNEEDDVFADFDFVEVALPPVEKKQKTLLIQQPFVSEDAEILSSSPNVQLNEDDIRLALDLISSTC